MSFTFNFYYEKKKQKKKHITNIRLHIFHLVHFFFRFVKEVSNMTMNLILFMLMQPFSISKKRNVDENGINFELI